MRASGSPPILANAPFQPRATAFTSREIYFARDISAPGNDLSPTSTPETPTILHASSSYRTSCHAPASQHPSRRREVRRRDTSAHLPGPSSKKPLPAPKGFPLCCSSPTRPLSHTPPSAPPGCLVLEDRTHPFRLSSPHSPRPGSCQNRHSARVLRTASPRSLAAQSHITSQCMHSKQAAGGAR